MACVNRLTEMQGASAKRSARKLSLLLLPAFLRRLAAACELDVKSRELIDPPVEQIRPLGLPLLECLDG